VDLRQETERGERLREQMLRQAVRHGIEDGIAGVTRLQIVDEVYDADYWAQYQAGLAGWQESEHGGREHTAQPGPAPTRHQAGEPHPDSGRADAGWHVSDRGIFVRGAAPAADPQPEVPFAMRMLTELGVPGGWTQPGPTVTHDYHSERMGVLDRQWAEPSLGLDHDGPEAG
jgi:hypothetical protein